ncbi:MAG: C4-type zinc ribbon domain-containing protein [Candidatus Omnitrophota bacterium]
MPETSLKSQLTNLIKLQAVDTQIYALQSEKSLKPREVMALETSFEEKKAKLAELDKKSLDLQKQRKDKELELASKDEAIKKLQGQLYGLKTNKEYQTMLQQIQDAKADASVIEDKVLELFDAADNVRKEAEKEKDRLKEEESVFLGGKKKIDERVREIDERLSCLQAQRKQALQEVEPKVLIQYERILSNRDGLAIVTVKGNSCGGCNMFVPPQVINLIKMYDHIITCEMCNRILYIEEPC